VLTGGAREGAGADALRPLRTAARRPDGLRKPAARPPRARRGAGAGGHRRRPGGQGDRARRRGGRRAHLRDNLRFYGAPVAMIFHSRPTPRRGPSSRNWAFSKTCCLGLPPRLGACPQAERRRRRRGDPRAPRFGADRLIVCALSAGSPDEAPPVNPFHGPFSGPSPVHTQCSDQAPPRPGPALNRVDEPILERSGRAITNPRPGYEPVRAQIEPADRGTQRLARAPSR